MNMVLNTTHGDYPTIWGSAGEAFGEKIGGTGMITPLRTGGFIYGGQVNLGVGLPIGPIPVNAAGGISNTFVLHDWGK